MKEMQARLHAENLDKFGRVDVKMAVIHYKVGLIFGVATALLTLLGNVVLKKLGL